jgi:SAM-dependent methyltransferase
VSQIILWLVLGLVVSFGCRTIPGQDVRYEPTPMPVVRALLELADVGPQDLVYDLGSGDGRIPITAATEFGARGVGIEIDPALVTQAQAKAREAGVEDKVEFRLGDMYAADVRSATVVTLFLHPGPNLKLREKLRSDLQPGSRVVSYVWDMGSWTPADVRRVNERRIFLWRIPSGPGLNTDPVSDCREGCGATPKAPSSHVSCMAGPHRKNSVGVPVVSTLHLPCFPRCAVSLPRLHSVSPLKDAGLERS